ncbi:MAG: C39 family peptidase [Ruminococcus sp.]|nr:C39 family peptidase [Ruminococcus sp.]
MKKRKKHKLIIPSIVLALLLTGSVFVSKTDTGTVPTNFECNHNSTEISSQETAEEKISMFALENGLSFDEWPQEIVELLIKNPETEEFVLNYPLMKDTYYDIELSDCRYVDSVPLFMQWDMRWGYTPYGDDCIAVSGCGPTCLSMVCVYLLKDTFLNPRVVAEFSEENGYCVPGNGSEWTLISEGGEELGICVDELPLDENSIRTNLEAGNPIICIMGEGDFTSSGHYIVMTDYIDGKIKVNDPNSVARSEKLWSYNKIEDQICNLWACSSPW